MCVIVNLESLCICNFYIFYNFVKIYLLILQFPGKTLLVILGISLYKKFISVIIK